ncbi:mechanosensitive ion channel family protein [Niabella drilacis]|uniref:Small-conductance mechanosensitive channel n=1 Tax=Niabella drilacis (strain DSM 25811 / CCM 8410 / CCUG 62505 / LMG 26954 / E90) TaxID=1285928 RepID=A0A1G6ZHE0_NIADE|nr:mechanosensitive ion channel domain-containing protein [Niabella drilacis]SDE02078.1 Small-conductance mechanosensitive channel [Niabella drilacis]
MEQHKKTIPVSFILRAITWILLSISFPFFEAFYTQHPYLLQVAYGLNTFLTASVIISIGKFIIVAFYNRRHAAHKVRGNFVLGISRLAAILNAIFAIIAVMIALGIDPREFITSMTIVAMAIAVIFREYITNMISGLIVMFSEQFSIGDHIRIGEHSGKIIDITFANIVVLNEEEDMVLVPNNLVFTATVINKSAQISNKLTVRFELPLAEQMDVQTLSARLDPVLKTMPDLTAGAEVIVRIAELGKDFVKYKIDLYAIDSSNRRQKRIESAVLNAVLDLNRGAA